MRRQPARRTLVVVQYLIDDRAATGRCRCWAGPTRCSSCCSVPPRRCSGTGWKPPARARRASSRRCAGRAASRSARSGVHLHQLWLLWLGCRRDRRLRPGPRLHLARVDADQVVSRPARHGHRPCHHGLRRRRDDRRAARGPADEALRDADIGGRRADAAGDGRCSISSPCCRARSAIACRRTGWKPAGWTPPPPTATALKTTRHVHVDRVLRHAAVLAAVGGAVPERQRRHRRRRHGLADAAGGVRRPPARRRRSRCRSWRPTSARRWPRSRAAFAGLLSLFNIVGRIAWASFSDVIGRKATYVVFFLLGIALYARAPSAGSAGLRGAVRRDLLRDPDHVRRRIRDDPGVPRRPVRHAACGRDPWPAAHRLVGGRHPGSGGRELHP